MRARSLFVAPLAALTAFLASGGALAQDAGSPAPASAPDKSGFTVFNPTPVADLRPLCTDRPTKSTGPCTVDAGHFQVESDLFNVTIDTAGPTSIDTYLITNPTLKLGLTNSIDVEASISPYEIVTVRDHATGLRTSHGGVGDLYLRVKWNLLGDDSGNLAIAIVPYIKAPTADHIIGNGALEGGVIVPVSINLPKGWSLVVDPEVDDLRNADDNGRHANTSGLVSFSHAVSKEVTASVELWSDVNLDPTGTVTQASFDLGLAWIPSKIPTFQLDGGVNLGLDRSTPAAQLYVGASKRF